MVQIRMSTIAHRNHLMRKQLLLTTLLFFYTSSYLSQQPITHKEIADGSRLSLLSGPDPDKALSDLLECTGTHARMKYEKNICSQLPAGHLAVFRLLTPGEKLGLPSREQKKIFVGAHAAIPDINVFNKIKKEEFKIIHRPYLDCPIIIVE